MSESDPARMGRAAAWLHLTRLRLAIRGPFWQPLSRDGHVNQHLAALIEAADAGNAPALTALRRLLARHPDEPTVLQFLWFHACDRRGPAHQLAVEHGRVGADAGWAGLAARLFLGMPVDLASQQERKDLLHLAGRDDVRDPPVIPIARAALFASERAEMRAEAIEYANENFNLIAPCVLAGWLPADEVDRAAFLLLAGEEDQYRAVDPDGTLTVAAYDRATLLRRLQLRAALTRLGGFDLVRRVVAGGGRTADVADRTYLVTELTARRRWPELWRLTPTLPLLDAVEAVRRMDDWRPDDPLDAELFDLLAAADPRDLRRQLDAADSPTVALGGTPLECAISPDGTRLAVVLPDEVRELRLPGGEVMARYRGLVPFRPITVAHVGDAILVACRPPGEQGRRPQRLIRCADGEQVTLLGAPRLGVAGRGRGGYVAVDLLGVRDLAPSRGGSVSRFPPGVRHVRPETAAVSPDGRRLAVCGARLTVLAVDGSRVLADAQEPTRSRLVTWLDDDHLVSLQRRGTETELVRWSLEAGRLVAQARAAHEVAVEHAATLVSWPVGRLVVAGSGSATPTATPTHSPRSPSGYPPPSTACGPARPARSS